MKQKKVENFANIALNMRLDEGMKQKKVKTFANVALKTKLGDKYEKHA